MEINNTFPMSPKEFESRMSSIINICDEEERHVEADELLCECLRRTSFGIYENGVRLFEEMKKWYS